MDGGTRRDRVYHPWFSPRLHRSNHSVASMIRPSPLPRSADLFQYSPARIQLRDVRLRLGLTEWSTAWWSKSRCSLFAPPVRQTQRSACHAQQRQNPRLSPSPLYPDTQPQPRPMRIHNRNTSSPVSNHDTHSLCPKFCRVREFHSPHWQNSWFCTDCPIRPKRPNA